MIETPESDADPPDDVNLRPAGQTEDAASSEPVADEVWLGEDLERMYQKALETVDAVEWQTGLNPQSDQTEESPDRSTDDVGDSANDTSSHSTASSGDEIQVESSTNDPPVSSDDSSFESNPSAAHARSDAPNANQVSVGTAETDVAAGAVRAQPHQIIEAALFVGGKPLTTKKLCSLFRGEFNKDYVEDTITELNLRYSDENRPYEIRFGEGGYRLVLRPEFEQIRNRVYGLGPKEVKLSQEALEVLALVAYKQPISAEQIDKLGKPNAGAMLRQLLRRQLIAIERGENRRKDVKYHTTPRFLQLFGLGHLDELPQAEELSFK